MTAVENATNDHLTHHKQSFYIRPRWWLEFDASIKDTWGAISSPALQQTYQCFQCHPCLMHPDHVGDCEAGAAVVVTKSSTLPTPSQERWPWWCCFKGHRWQPVTDKSSRANLLKSGKTSGLNSPSQVVLQCITRTPSKGNHCAGFGHVTKIVGTSAATSSAPENCWHCDLLQSTTWEGARHTLST